MKEVSYYAPTQLDEAVGLLAEHGEKITVLAGGTDILPKLNHYEIKPDILVYLGKLGLDYIKEEDGQLLIGAATTTAKIAASELVAEKAGAVAEAAKLSGSIAIRNAATIGGNIANASPAADLVVALLALDASVKLVGSGGERVVALNGFFQGPNKTDLKPDELIKEVLIPNSGGKSVFLKMGRRKAQTLSVVNVAVQMSIDQRECKDARIVLGSMAAIPVRCLKAEGVIRSCALPLATGHFNPGGQKGSGKNLDEATIKQCAAQAVAECSPIDDQRASAWYRKKVGHNLVSRALRVAAELE